jgi:hypothetical protein
MLNLWSEEVRTHRIAELDRLKRWIEVVSANETIEERKKLYHGILKHIVDRIKYIEYIGKKYCIKCKVEVANFCPKCGTKAS